MNIDQGTEWALAALAECESLLAESRDVLAEADRLIAQLDLMEVGA